jgi:plasmid stabilization system protein ParE
MARIVLMPAIFDDFDRFVDHMARFDVSDAPERIRDIIDAIKILARSPEIGRPVKDGKRELVIGRGTRGYVALYRFAATIDTVFVLAMRSQREGGYRHPG